MPLKRIAGELHMGIWTHLNRLLYAWKQSFPLGRTPEMSTAD